MNSDDIKSSQLVKTEVFISYVLRYGVILCSATIALGLGLRLMHFGFSSISSKEVISRLTEGKELVGFQPPYSPSEFIQGILNLQPEVIMSLGLVLLITLPIVRVGMTVMIFLIEKDWTFLALTSLVFSILIFGIIFGRTV